MTMNEYEHCQDFDIATGDGGMDFAYEKETLRFKNLYKVKTVELFIISYTKIQNLFR